MDGRFFFPAHSIRWEVLEANGVCKHHNPIGRAFIYDIVLRSESVKRLGAIILRNRGAVMSFAEPKREWGAMRGYTGFWKGVKIMQKPPTFCETIRPGAIRSCTNAAALSSQNEHEPDQKEFEFSENAASDWGAFADV